MNLHELTSLNLSKDASKCSEFMAAPIFQQKYMTSKNDTQVGLINDDLFKLLILATRKEQITFAHTKEVNCFKPYPTSGNLDTLFFLYIDNNKNLYYYDKQNERLLKSNNYPVNFNIFPGIIIGLDYQKQIDKYGARGYRYALLDLGHFYGVISMIASSIKWSLRIYPVANTKDVFFVITKSDKIQEDLDTNLDVFFERLSFIFSISSLIVHDILQTTKDDLINLILKRRSPFQFDCRKMIDKSSLSQVFRDYGTVIDYINKYICSLGVSISVHFIVNNIPYFTRGLYQILPCPVGTKKHISLFKNVSLVYEQDLRDDLEFYSCAQELASENGFTLILSIDPTFRSKITNKTPNIIYQSSQVMFSAYPSY